MSSYQCPIENSITERLEYTRHDGMSPADQYDTLVDGTVFVYLGLVIVESLNRPNIVEDL